MSDSESSSSSSSSDDGRDVKDDVDIADIKLQQLRRKARAKAEAKEGKGNARLSGLQSFDDMMREHALQRMQDGMKALLMLHTPSELSSICGVLELSVKEKASSSIRMIIEYASQGQRLDPARMKSLLSIMWEGALFEYLKSIGHPVISMFVDPRDTIMKIWQEGGIIGAGEFIPSFVAREVKKRYEWVVSPDLEEKLVVLRREQEFVKRAEKEMLTGADFTYVLKYLKKLNNLRGLENGFREYAMGELEIARSRLDSQKETATMIREDQAELEEKLIVLSQAMSEKLAYSEFVAETYMKDNIQTETDLQRLTEIMESYIEAEEDRAESGGGTAQAASLRHADLSRQTVRNLHGKMQEYRNMRDEHDEQLRERARGHVAEIDRLEKHLLELEHKLEYTTRDLVFHRARADAAEEDVKFCAKKMMKMAINKQFGVQESWAFGLRRALLVTDYERKMSEAKILCKAALQESDNPLVVLMAQGINDIFQLISPDDQRELNEIESMTKADAFSLKLRRYLKEREQMSKGKPKKAGNKDDGVDSKKSSKSKKGDDDDDDEDDEGGKDSKKTGKKSKKGKGGDKEKGDKKKKKKK